MIRAAIATLLIASFALTVGGSSAVADSSDHCERHPDAELCLLQATDQVCVEYGPDSIECLSARNAYLEHRVAIADATTASLFDIITLHVRRIAFLEQRVDRQADTIERLRDRLRDRD